MCRMLICHRYNSLCHSQPSHRGYEYSKIVQVRTYKHSQLTRLTQSAILPSAERYFIFCVSFVRS